MPRRRNKPEDVFKYINMHNGDISVCWEWTHTLGGRADQRRPYFTVSGKKRIAYHIVYELVHGSTIPEGQIIRHMCDNGICCNPHHHVLGTHQQNMDDMKERERHGLSHYVVKAMRTLSKEGVTHEEIAKRYGVARRTVTDAVNGTTYSEIEC